MFAKQNSRATDCALVSSINLLNHVHHSGIKNLLPEDSTLRVYTYPNGDVTTLSLNNENLKETNFLSSADENDILVEKIILSNNDTFKIKNIPSMLYSLTENPYIIIDLELISISVIKNLETFYKFINNIIAPEFELEKEVNFKIFGCGTLNHDLAINRFNATLIEVIDPLDPFNSLTYTENNFINFLANYKYFYISFDSKILKSLPLHVYKKELFFDKDSSKIKTFRVDLQNKKNVLYLIYKSEKPNIRLVKTVDFHDMGANVCKKSLFNNTNLEMKTALDKSTLHITLESKDDSNNTVLDILSDSGFSVTEMRPTHIMPIFKLTSHNQDDENWTAEVSLPEETDTAKECTLFFMNSKTRVTDDSKVTFNIKEYSNNFLVHSFSTNNPYLTFKPKKAQKFTISIEKPQYLKHIESGDSFQNISNLSSLDYTFYYDIKLYKYVLLQNF